MKSLFSVCRQVHLHKFQFIFVS